MVEPCALGIGGSGWSTSNIITLLGTNGSNFAAGSSLGFDTTNANYTYGGLAGNMGLSKLGSNTLTVTGANTFAGRVTISGGTLQFGTGAGGYDGSLSSIAGILDNAALYYNLSGSQTYSGPISGTGTLTKLNNTLLVLTGSDSYAGQTTISGGTLQFGNGTNRFDGPIATGGIALANTRPWSITSPARKTSPAGLAALAA